MDLILWRHAQAVGQSGDPDDWARRLTPKGEKQAQRMARWLNLHLPQSARVLCSPAVRAEATVTPLGRSFKVVPELAPEASADMVLQAVHWPSAKGVHLIVGHQPTLGQVAARLIGLPAGEIAIKKGALWWLRRQEDGAVQVVTVQTPDLLSR